MRAIALAATAAALLLAGCTQSSAGTSTSGFKGAEKDVAQKVADLAEDGQRKRAADICDDVVATRLRDQIRAAGSSCAQEMKKAIDDADGFALDVTDVTITGDAASAKVKSTSAGKDVVRTFRFVKESGGWRISAFG
jgi:hypothetical protein